MTRAAHELDTLCVPVEFKAIDEAGRFIGYAAVFATLDLLDDIRGRACGGITAIPSATLPRWPKMRRACAWRVNCGLTTRLSPNCAT